MMVKLVPNEHDVDLIFLIDRSGSMYGSEMDTIGGFNAFLQKEKQRNSIQKSQLYFLIMSMKSCIKECLFVKCLS